MIIKKVGLTALMFLSSLRISPQTNKTSFIPNVPISDSFSTSLAYNHMREVMFALKNLERKVPSFVSLESDLKDQRTMISIRCGCLPHTDIDYTLGVTDIHIVTLNNTKIIWFDIIIDVDNINSVDDCIEPVIAHEFKHVWDAIEKYGLLRFFELTDKESRLPYGERELEKSANGYEHSVRVYLKTHYKEFKGIYDGD